MNKVDRFPTSLALLLALIASCAASCATQAPQPEPTAAPLAPLPPPPAGSQRLPGGVTCETDVSCSACADEHDKELVRFGLLVHASDVHGCYDRVTTIHPGIEGRVVLRLGIDPTGTVGSSCVVRSSLNDPELDRCLADKVLTWKFSAPARGGWALVDQPFVFTRR
ncbi:MAG: domain/TonB protein [Myxococcales bacterium]|nr:domain/TonB protein [Myxococcales bacterium]